MDDFREFLPAELLKQIKTHEIVTESVIGDTQLKKKNSPKGRFIIKSAMKLTRKEEDGMNNDKWDVLQQAPIIQQSKSVLGARNVSLTPGQI